MKKQKVNVNYPFTHRRKYHLLLGGELYFISYFIYIYILLFFSKILFISCISQDLLG